MLPARLRLGKAFVGGRARNRAHPVVAELGPYLHGRGREVRIHEGPHPDAVGAGHLAEDPVHGGTAGSAEVERHAVLVTAGDPHTVDLEPVVHVRLAGDPEYLVVAEVRDDLHDTAGLLLTEVAMTCRDEERLTLYADAQTATSALRNP